MGRTNPLIEHGILNAAYYILRDKVPYREPKVKQKILEQRRKAEIERLERRIQKLKTLASNLKSASFFGRNIPHKQN